MSLLSLVQLHGLPKHSGKVRTIGRLSILWGLRENMPPGMVLPQLNRSLLIGSHCVMRIYGKTFNDATGDVASIAEIFTSRKGEDGEDDLESPQHPF